MTFIKDKHYIDEILYDDVYLYGYFHITRRKIRLDYKCNEIIQMSLFQTFS